MKLVLRHVVGVVGIMLIAIATTVGFGATAALAHAQLESTDPAAGAILDESPAAITLRFSESIDIALGGVRVFDGRGTTVDVGDASHPEGRSDEVRLGLPELANGSYVVDWRVVSSDGHPIQGAFTFQIGPTSDLQPGIVDDIVGSGVANGPAKAGLAVSRGIVIAAIAVLFGGLVAVAAGIVAPSRRLRIASWAAVGAGSLFGLLLLPLEVGYAKGGSLAVLFDTDAWSTALDTRIGLGWLVRSVLIAVGGSALLTSWSQHRTAVWQCGLAAAIVAVGVASAFGGHGAAGRWVPLAIAATAIHVGAMAVWLGGLFALVLDFAAAGAAGIRRFSNVALAMVVLVVVSGVLQGYRQLGSWQAFTESSYGGILLWKIALVALLLAVASVSRKLVAVDIGSGAGNADAGRLRRAVTLEVVIAVAIVTATSLLMGANPSVAAQAQPFSGQYVNGDYLLAVTVDPAAVGPNEMHLYLSNATSSLSQPDEVTLTLSDPGSDIAPIAVDVVRSGAGHYTAVAASFPYAADWVVTVVARYNEFDQITFTATVPVR